MHFSLHVGSGVVHIYKMKCPGLGTHEELLLRFHMKMADATAHVTAPRARYRLRLS
jgi:hypothetical protein